MDCRVAAVVEGRGEEEAVHGTHTAEALRGDVGALLLLCRQLHRPQPQCGLHPLVPHDSEAAHVEHRLAQAPAAE